MNLPDGYLFLNNKYQITRTIGQGGFGITYKGIWHTEVKGSLGAIKTEVPVCIKEYFFKDYCYRDADDSSVKVHSQTGNLLFNKFKEKLIKEAKILSDVHHPHIVNVLEVFEENNTAYIAMEYIDGNSLKNRLDKNGFFSESEALFYIRQIGEALDFVHAKNILHLDVKPSNILIDANGDARLIDFGVSRRFDVGEEDTSTTLLTLSKGFASIEQYDNEGIQNFSPCPDIYSLGATCYNLLTGKIPTESILRVTRALIQPSDWNKQISAQTEAVILKAMAITPEDRYQSVKEMLADLDFSKVHRPDDYYQKIQIQSEKPVEDEQTVLLNKTTRLLDIPENSDDETVYTPVSPKPEDQSESDIKPRAKRILFWSVSLFPVVCILLIAFYFIRQWQDVETLAPLILNESSEMEPTVSAENVMPSFLSSEVKQDLKELQATAKKEVTEDKPSSADTDKETIVETLKANVENALNITTDSENEEKEIDYNALVEKGKNRLNAGDFAQARKDFVEAKELRLTEEIVRLLISCDEKETLQRIVEKKKLYEEKRTFGKFTIVRKIDTGRYGAIDVNGDEKIPCKYLNVGITNSGRAFEREDGLFDIYNDEGVLTNKGSTYY